MRPLWVCRVGALLLSVVVATSLHAQTSEKIVVDGSTGVMPLASALAKAYQERNPAAMVEMGKGLGTTARLKALTDGKIDIALASHGLVDEELTRQERKIYTLTRDSFLVTRAQSSPAVVRFVEFIRSSAGTAVIVANGAVPVK